MVREILWLLATLLVIHVDLAGAQETKKVPRIGYLTGTSAPTITIPDLNADAFRQGLQDLGHIEGKNILIEYRFGAGNPDRAASLVAELGQLKVDVIVSTTPSGIHAAKQATKTIPIVMVTTQDSVATRMVDSLAQPGGNITGLTRLTRELSGKRLKLLMKVVPTILRVGVLLDADSTTSGNAFKDYETAARALKMHFNP